MGRPRMEIQFERNEMREITKRTAAFSIAIAAFGLVGSACSHNNSNSGSSSSASTSAASSPASSETSSASAATTPAGPSTQINGANGTPYTVQGPILAKFQTLNDAQKKDLGAPYDNEKKTLDGSGSYQQFEIGRASCRERV